MNVPSPLPSGEPAKRGWEKVREILQYLRSIRLVAGHGIRLQHYHAGIVIESTGNGTGSGGGATDYTGIFAVTLDSDSLSVAAGRCYVNGEPIEVEEVSDITPSSGWLLLTLYRSESNDRAARSQDSEPVSSYDVEYLIEEEIPPVQTAYADDDPTPVLKYPIAQIEKEDENWKIVQTHFYNPPFLTMASNDYSGFFAVTLDSDSLSVAAGRCYVNGDPVAIEEASGISLSSGWLLLAITRSGSTGESSQAEDGESAFSYEAEYLIEDKIPPMPTATIDDPNPVLKYPIAQIEQDNGIWNIKQTHINNPPLLAIYGDCETWGPSSEETETSST